MPTFAPRRANKSDSRERLLFGQSGSPHGLVVMSALGKEADVQRQSLGVRRGFIAQRPLERIVRAHCHVPAPIRNRATL